MIPVNPEAIGLFGLFATVICFGLEQLGVGVKGADHEKLTRTLGYIAIFFGGFTQLFTSLCMYHDAFVHFDIPLTKEHEAALLKEVGFTVTVENGNDCLIIKAVK